MPRARSANVKPRARRGHRATRARSPAIGSTTPEPQETSGPSLLQRVRDAWHLAQVADEQLVNAIAEAHDVGGHTYRRMADFLVEATGNPALTNERRRKLGNVLKERRGRAQRATRRCADRGGVARTGLHDGVAESQDVGTMSNPNVPYRRRTVDEWYSPDGLPPDVEDLNGADDEDDFEDDDDDDDRDHLGDAADGSRGPGSR